MAKPRVFISSTFYDLKHVRNDIGQFVKETGYDTILFERGQIAYGKDQRPEEYCYSEIELADILVCVIGGRYGTESSQGIYSITQNELKRALELGKQVYIFLDKNVEAEYETYKLNKDNTDMKYRHADDKKVYEFLDEIYHLPRNNSIFGFESSQDITRFLKEQWSGLFQRLLRKEEEKSQYDIAQTLRSTALTLENMVNVVMEKNENQGSVFTDIILFNHPAFNIIKNLLNITYRVSFLNIDELEALIKSRGYKRVDENPFDEHYNENSYYYIWSISSRGKVVTIKVHKSLFNENGELIPHQSNLESNMIIKEVDDAAIDDDDLPF